MSTRKYPEATEEVAKELVLTYGPEAILEHGDEIMRDLSFSLIYVKDIQREARKQAARVFHFLGYDPPRRWYPNEHDEVSLVKKSQFDYSEYLTRPWTVGLTSPNGVTGLMLVGDQEADEQGRRPDDALIGTAVTRAIAAHILHAVNRLALFPPQAVDRQEEAT